MTVVSFFVFQEFAQIKKFVLVAIDSKRDGPGYLYPRCVAIQIMFHQGSDTGSTRAASGISSGHPPGLNSWYRTFLLKVGIHSIKTKFGSNSNTGPIRPVPRVERAPGTHQD